VSPLVGPLCAVAGRVFPGARLFSAWEAGHSLGSAAASLWPKKGFLSQAARAGALLDYRFLRLVCVIVHLGDFRGGGCNCT